MLLLAVAVLLGGCQSVGYYHQAIRGHCQILSKRRPIPEVVADTNTPPLVKQNLECVLRLRDFAEKELLLPTDGHYLRYADLGRHYAVWNVHAAPEFSMEPKAWWYPLVGRLKYRGYFAEAKAQKYAQRLQNRAYDVYVEGVEAYSTLGWFTDPVLNTFIHHSQSDLAEILFHELAHQRLFVGGDTDFNEAFATATAQEGVRRWLRAQGDPEALGRYGIRLERTAQFVSLVMRARQRLQTLYDDPMPKGHSSGRRAPDQALKANKQLILLDLLKEYERLKASWGGPTGLDEWFARSLNNAQLNTVATYYELVPAFNCLLETNKGDLAKFYQSVRVLGKAGKSERHKRLKALLKDTQ